VTWARARSCAWVERVLPASCRRGGRVRFVGSTSHAGFLEDSWSAAATTAECLIAAEVAREDIMLGLRLSGGVTASAVEDAELTREIQELEELGLIEYMDVQESAERWRLTKRGWLLGNEVFRRVWTGE
jgi:coproporphyrinogen III oxidase-like Fe-S oxidoreductase